MTRKLERKYGVFPWREDNLSRLSTPLRVYAVQKAAETYADQLNKTDDRIAEHPRGFRLFLAVGHGGYGPERVRGSFCW